MKKAGPASDGKKLCPITRVNESTTAILGCRMLQNAAATEKDTGLGL